MKEETFDDINGERNFTQSLTLKNVCDAKLNVSVSLLSSLGETPGIMPRLLLLNLHHSTIRIINN